ncbi:MAG TPA: zf-HC2 domain-containing protein [Pyrinomonadaceae bacterium]|nr:zf-HC2 domain-containing protein [Pyrinomonadaceae bacterium]
MDACLDEGTLQAYLDGELSPGASDTTAAHLAACDACAAATREAEQELALFSTAYAPALNASVPTEKLRARLDEAIAGMDARPQFAPIAPPRRAVSRLRSYLDSFIASLTTFTPRQATAFASFLVAVALVLVFALMQRPDSSDASKDVASVKETPAPASPAVQDGNAAPPNTVNAAPPSVAATVQTPVTNFDRLAPARDGGDRVAFVKAGQNARPRVASARAARGGEAATSETIAADATVTAVAAATTGEPALADEKTYLTSIASLTSAIEAQGAEGMTPTLRAEYERNLAVVNQAILSSRAAVRRNPQDTDAKEFLRAAYQNKVELLSAVSDQTQLASGRD